jgi:hypothetical protein
VDRGAAGVGDLNLNSYSFRSTWTVDLTPEESYAVLRSIGDFDKWWPEIKEMHRIDEQRVDIRARSLLPYDLWFVGEPSEDPERRTLTLTMTGDLEGFSRFTIEPDGRGSRLLFEEQVVANKPLLRRLALFARPFFVANHWIMMRRGEAGLRTFAAGYRLANEDEA